MDRVVLHEIEDYYILSDDTKFMNHNGIPDVWEYSKVEHIKLKMWRMCTRLEK